MSSWITRCTRLFSSVDPSWSAIPLRLIVGYGFVAHGYAKIVRGPDSFVRILDALGMPAPSLLAWATILVEVSGGLAVLAGLFVPLASGPMIVVLLVAIFTVHLPNGFSSIKLLAVTAGGARFGQPGYETDLLYLAALIALLIVGTGPFTLDRVFVRHLAGVHRVGMKGMTRLHIPRWPFRSERAGNR